MLRAILLLKYLVMFEDVRLVVTTVRHLASPFLGMLFAFYLITYEFQVVG